MPKSLLPPCAILAIFLASALAQETERRPAPAQPMVPIVGPAPVTTPEQPASASTPPMVPVVGGTPVTTPEQPAPIDPPLEEGTTPGPVPQQAPAAADTTLDLSSGATPGRTLNEFQGDDIGQVLRLLARQAKVNLVVSEKVVGTVTMRLENVSPTEAIKIIATSKGLILDQTAGVYYVKTKEEKAAEPTESANYAFSYANAEKVLPLLQAQLQSTVPAQFDVRTNTVFFREVQSNMDKVKLFLQTVDTPTQQVMIEARLVEVTANPSQRYGINWAGALSGQTVSLGGSTLGTTKLVPAQSVTTNTVTSPSGVAGQTNVQTTQTVNPVFDPVTGAPVQVPVVDTLPEIETLNGKLRGTDFLRDATNTFGGGILSALGGQFAILSAPQLSATISLINQDSDAEFLANPRVVTANNQKATIKITTAQPVPQLNFNEQTASAVFGGFVDKEYGNTLEVTPSINKDDFVTLLVKPEISNKTGDAVFTFGGANVSSPIIDKRTLESNVLIKSGDTLAIGGLLQDAVIKSRTKVPLLGDIPMIGYLFQERVNTRTKRNLLVFVTPTIIRQGYGTGLEDQVSGLHHSGEEYADPNGWRNNAKGAVRVVPTSQRQIATDYPKPGTPMAPVRNTRSRASAESRRK